MSLEFRASGSTTKHILSDRICYADHLDFTFSLIHTVYGDAEEASLVHCPWYFRDIFYIHFSGIPASSFPLDALGFFHSPRMSLPSSVFPRWDYMICNFPTFRRLPWLFR